MSNATKTVKRIANIVPAWGVCWERFETAKKMLINADISLDLGCSEYGGIGKYIAKNCGKTIGVDLKKDIDMKMLDGNFFYVVADAQHLPFKNASFPQIACLDMIEHVKDDKKAAEEIEKVGKKGANIVLSTPSEFWKFPYYSFMKIFCKSEEQTLKEFGHVKKGYSETELKNLFSNCNIVGKRYFVSGLSALAYDIEFSRMYILENLLLKILSPFLWLNFRFSKHDTGTHIAVRMKRC